MFNAKSNSNLERREEFFLSRVDNEMRDEEKENYHYHYIKLNSGVEWGKRIPSVFCELMIKWRRFVCNVHAFAHLYAIVERLDTFISLSLYVSAVRVSLLLFVRRCGGEKEAFIVLSVRYWNTRGMIVRGESGTSGWKMESRLARRLFLPCRLITSCKHPSRGESVKNARDEIFFLSVFFSSFHFFLYFLFYFFFCFLFLWLGCKSKRAFATTASRSLKKLFFAAGRAVFSIRVTRTSDLPPVPKQRRKFNKRAAANCSSAIQ